MSASTAAGVGTQVAQLADMARAYPDEVGYRVVDGGQLTFSQWDRESNRLARGLVASGVGHGDRVALRLSGVNALRWVVAYAAIHKAGGVAVPIDPRLAPPEVVHMLAHAGVRVLVADGERVESALASVAEQPQRLAALSVVVDASIAGVDGTGLPPCDTAGTGGGAGPRCLSWDEVLDDDGSGFQVPVHDDDLSEILFTSGTTGHPKGVAVRHANASSVPNATPSWSGALWLHASPLATFAGITFVYTPMKLGLTSTYQPQFDAGRWLTFVESEHPLAVFLVPAMVQLLVSHPRFDDADLSSIGICSVGSAPLAPTAIDRLQERMPDAAVSNNYGMTEAGSVYCLMPKGEAVRRPGSVGKPLPPAEVRCVDADGEAVPAGTYGEVRLRIPGRPREYFDDPDATAAAWVDGWLRTGDIGRLDQDGYLYIGGRAKDVIIRGGSNIHAVDVEHVILTHPAVAEVAVIGVPHDVLGED
ncbi:MAG TPA: class I adenylate-forming enzyme family protein, partial [Acidimicrobiales bacterium]|nr:class I adenylate-forming enzyme family protein [Acidimicrobiales bacterium]